MYKFSLGMSYGVQRMKTWSIFHGSKPDMIRTDSQQTFFCSDFVSECVQVKEIGRYRRIDAI